MLLKLSASLLIFLLNLQVAEIAFVVAVAFAVAVVGALVGAVIVVAVVVAAVVAVVAHSRIQATRR